MATEQKEPTRQENILHFQTLLAEGTSLLGKAQFDEAIETLTKALEILARNEEGEHQSSQNANFGKINCLISRSSARLGSGDGSGALADAEEALAIVFDPHALLAKAEALYTLGNFEGALIQFHRGINVKPDWSEFKRGIDKCTDAIKQAVHSVDTRVLRKYQKDKQQKLSISDVPVPSSTKKEKCPTNKEDPETYRFYLEELMEDHIFLSSLSNDPYMKNSSFSDLKQIVMDSIDYLNTRADFWRQRQPVPRRMNAPEQVSPTKEDESKLKRGSKANDIHRTKSSSNKEINLQKAPPKADTGRSKQNLETIKGSGHLV